jgi:hypothetical protein
LALTVTADDEWDKVCGAQSTHEEKVGNCACTEERDESICCFVGWNVLVQGDMGAVAFDIHFD